MKDANEEEVTVESSLVTDLHEDDVQLGLDFFEDENNLVISEGDRAKIFEECTTLGQVLSFLKAAKYL